MNRRLLGLLSTSGLAVLAGCFAGGGTDESESGNQAVVDAESLDDSFAQAVLGGCEVSVNGSVGRAPGAARDCPTGLNDILNFTDKLPSKPKVFVVSEQLDQPEQAHYRFVLSGKHNGLPFFLATVGGASLGGDRTEAMGFSPSLQAFAYYRVEGGRWVRNGDGTQVPSNAKDARAPFECINCHTTGAPLMKELHDGWGNWMSTWDSSPQAPSKANDLFKRLFGAITRADTLELDIIEGTKLHSKGRVDRAAAAGSLKGVLTQLMCDVGEATLIGAHGKSSSRMGKVVTSSSLLPGAIMLNQLFTPPATGTGPEKGLEQSLNLALPSARSLSVDPTAYSKAIEDNGQRIGGRPGDNIFPMTSPEKSFADLDVIQELLRRDTKLIDRETIADALMTDYTVATFSKIRCDLASTIPNTWSSPSELKTQWIASLERSNLRGAKGLARRLSADDLPAHTAKIEAFAGACGKRAPAELTADVLKIMSQRRVEFAERYGNVIESEWLIPEDDLGSRAGAIRFSPTCEIEPQSKPFDGEE